MTATLSVNGNNNGGVLYYPYAPSNMIEQNGAVEFYLSFDSAMAVPFAFDDNCHLSRPNIAYGADKSFAYDGQFHTSLRMGTEAFVNQGSAGNIAPVTCRSTAGVLKCGAGHDFIPLGLTTFCQVSLWLDYSSALAFADFNATGMIYLCKHIRAGPCFTCPA